MASGKAYPRSTMKAFAIVASICAGLASGLKTNGTFQSQGEIVAYDLYSPVRDSSTPIPVIVAAPGFPGVKELYFPPYGEALSAAGIALMVFDYPGFGESTGKQRQDVVIEQQHTAYKDGISFVAKDARYDPKRIGVLGKSLSGAHSIFIAATDDRVKVAASIVPHIKANANTVEQRVAFIDDISADVQAKASGGKRIMVPAFGPPKSRAVMTTDGASDYLGKFVGTSNYVNSVTASSMLEIAGYDVSSKAKGVPKPIIVFAGAHDTITPAKAIVDAFDDVKSANVITLEGEHFTVTEIWRDVIVESTTKFFRSHLL